jgi:hypothetical protein
MVLLVAKLAAAGVFGLLSIVQPVSPASTSVSDDDTAENVMLEPTAPFAAIAETHVITTDCPAFVATAPFVIERIVPLPVTMDDVNARPRFAWLVSVQRASAWSAVQSCVDAVRVITPVVAGKIVVVLSAKTMLCGVSAEKSVLGVAAVHESDVG